MIFLMLLVAIVAGGLLTVLLLIAVNLVCSIVRALPLISRAFLLWLEWEIYYRLFEIFGHAQYLQKEMKQLDEYIYKLSKEINRD